MENLNLEVIKNKEIDIEAIKFFLNDEHFVMLKDFLIDEDYAMAKDATKGLYILALELQLFSLYEGLLEIFEDLEDELYGDVMKHYDEMFVKYKKVREEYDV